MRTPDPQISFADLEFIKQGIRLEPTLKAIADFLDQHGAIVQRVRRDLVRGLKKPTTGRTDRNVTRAEQARPLRPECRNSRVRLKADTTHEFRRGESRCTR